MNVRAEKGSKITVESEAGRRIATRTGTAGNQTIKFRAKTGRHTYIATATDKAGNTSDEASVTVRVDADAPPVRDLRAAAATDATGASTLAFTSEPGATWTIAGTHMKTLHGTVKAKTTTVSLWLPNGTYRPELTVRDRVGNTRRKTVNIHVRVSRPLLRIERTSTANVGRLSYTVTGMPRSTGRFVLGHALNLAFRINDQGTSTVGTDVADGVYGPGTATLTDFAGRRATEVIPQAVVDTTPPGLTLIADPHQAQKGTLSLAVTAEPQAAIHLTSALLGATLDETATAGSGPLIVTRKPKAGTYRVTASAEDAAGNITTRQATVLIVVPATPAEIALGLAIVVLLAVAGVLLPILAWRHRHRLRAWWARRKVAAEQRAAARAAAAAQAAFEARWRAFENDRAAHQDAEAVWSRHRDHLAGLVRFAETHRPAPETTLGVKLKRGETCYGESAAVMVEERSRDGGLMLTEVSSGQAVITSHRLMFAADKNREWVFDKLQNAHHPSADLTILTVTNRKHQSGVRVPASVGESFRLRFELALADSRNDRASVVTSYRERLRMHDRARPIPPTPPERPHDPKEPQQIGVPEPAGRRNGQGLS